MNFIFIYFELNFLLFGFDKLSQWFLHALSGASNLSKHLSKGGALSLSKGGALSLSKGGALSLSKGGALSLSKGTH